MFFWSFVLIVVFILLPLLQGVRCCVHIAGAIVTGCVVVVVTVVQVIYDEWIRQHKLSMQRKK